MKLFDKNGYVRKQVFDALEKAWISKPPAILADSILDTISDLIRYNTVYSVARAGTGHLGASLSIIELLTCIYYVRFAFSPKNTTDENRDIFILSKGHAVPALYATLAAKGYIKIDELDNLRRLGGLQGHCDISVNGIEANTGSLAMGLSRAVGYALAKKRMGHEGKVIVIVGDGELQEGQVWEALLSASSYGLSNLYVIIDSNKVQTDQFVYDVVKYKNLYHALDGMGYAVLHMKVPTVADAAAGFDALDVLDKYSDKPKALIADTVKGYGVSFMEHTACMVTKEDRYAWHNKAPNMYGMEDVHFEITKRVRNVLKQLDVTDVTFPELDIPKKTDELLVEGEPLTPAFADFLFKTGAKNDKLVVFDADLEADCGLTPFRKKYSGRFFEMGIMEQHMVSSAAAFARMGYFPVINSYTAFLTSRANEQIYNYASEGYKGLFIGHMSGVIPATPGKSHQAYRDIACMKNIPGILMYQPATPGDTSAIMKRTLNDELGNIVYLRLSMAPSAIKLPDASKILPAGKPVVMKKGKDAILISAGPVMLGECLAAAQALKEEGINVEVINHPWLNVFDKDSLESIVNRGVPIIVAEDHYKDGGLGEGLFAAIAKAGLHAKKVVYCAVDNFTTTGLRTEALRHFGLDRESIAQRIRGIV